MRTSILTRTAGVLALARSSRNATRIPASFRVMSTKLDAENISKITQKEKEVTRQEQPVKGGPTAQAQKHAGEGLGSKTISAITKGEKNITGGERVKGGPTSTAQRILTIGGNTSDESTTNTTSASSDPASGFLDSATISKITATEKSLTGSDNPTKGGPTSQAQKHLGEPITSEALHDITEGEKRVTGGERVKGGPTSTAQSELGRARQARD